MASARQLGQVTVLVSIGMSLSASSLFLLTFPAPVCASRTFDFVADDR